MYVGPRIDYLADIMKISVFITCSNCKQKTLLSVCIDKCTASHTILKCKNKYLCIAQASASLTRFAYTV